MEKPALKKALLDMLSVTDTAVDSIGQPTHYKKSDVVSPSSSISQQSSKESVGSTTASEVLISATYVRDSNAKENKSPPKPIKNKPNKGRKPSFDEKFEQLKDEKNKLFKILSCDDEDVTLTSQKDESSISVNSQVVGLTSPRDKIITVRGKITNINTRLEESSESSEPEHFSQKQKTNKLFFHKEEEVPVSEESVNLNSGSNTERSETQESYGSSVQGDVYIQKFHLTEKEKSLKQALSKRSGQSAPVKRVIQPKFVKKTVQETVTIRKEEVENGDNGNLCNENLAATVAASAAAAAVQPLIKFQKEFEEKLNKTYGLVTQPVPPPSAENDRINELEKKVIELNEQRLAHLEKLQEYQMEIQAQMLSLPCKQRPCESNLPQTQTTEQKYIEQKHYERKKSPQRVYASPVQSPTKRSPPKRETKYFPVKLNKTKKKAPVERYEQPGDSPFDTPAPRTRVPTPMEYQPETLSRPLESRQRDDALMDEILAKNTTPLKDSTFSVPEYPKSSYNSDQYGERPVEQANRLLDKMINLKNQVGQVVDTKPTMNHHNGPYPLDPYLKPSLSDVLVQPSKPMHVNAPVFNNYSDVKKVLNTVNKKINLLESNLKHVNRTRQTDEIACLAKVLAPEGDAMQQSKIKAMVDKYIRAQKKVIEGEVRKELLNAELKQKGELLPTKEVEKKKNNIGRGAPSFMLKKKETVPTVSGKENRLASSSTSYRPAEKNLLLNNRMKVPVRSAPPQKPSNIRRQPAEVRRKSPPRTQVVAPANNIIPMAVPLCNPRFRPGRTQYGVLSCEPIASSSPSSKHLNVSLNKSISNIGDTTITELNQRMSSPVGRDSISEITEGNYDSVIHNDLYNEDQFGTGIALPGYQRPPPLPVQKPKSPPAKIIAKPPTLESYTHQPSSDVIATDMHRQNVLENKAFEWLQNELMGIVMSKVSTDPGVRRETSLYEDNEYRYTHLDNQQISDDEESKLTQESEESGPSVQNESKDNVKQLFVDAGQPVNDQLVATLVREALRERVLTMLGNPQENQDDEKQRKTGKEPDNADAARNEYDDDDFETESPELSERQIRTPDLTPFSSPRDSPLRIASPVPEVRQPSPSRKEVTKASVDDSALYNSLLPAEPAARLPSPDSDSEISTSYDISQELRRLATKPDEKEDFVPSLHDVHTPTATPPPPVSPSPPPPAVHTLPVFTSSPPPQQTPILRSPVATMTDRDELDRSRDQLGATGMSLFNRTQTSIDEYSHREEVKGGTHIIRVESRNETVSESHHSPTRPPVPERSLKSPVRPQTISPAASPEPKSLSSSITDTVNECISEGQWLLNRSEGQIADLPLDPVLLQSGRFNQIDLSTASTYKDTDDLDLDDMDVLKSEGEFLHYSSVPVERNMARVLEMREQTFQREVENYPTHYTINTYPVTEENKHTADFSIGQVPDVGNDLHSTIGETFSRPQSSMASERRQMLRHSERDYEDTPDSTMNLDELENSKGSKGPIQVKPRTTGNTFSFSGGSLRFSQMQQSFSDAESSQYKMTMSMESEGSGYSYDKEEEADLKPRESFGSGTYRMSVTVPSVEPVLEDDDSEEISEIDATNPK